MFNLLLSLWFVVMFTWSCSLDNILNTTVLIVCCDGPAYFGIRKGEMVFQECWLKLGTKERLREWLKRNPESEYSGDTIVQRLLSGYPVRFYTIIIWCLLYNIVQTVLNKMLSDLYYIYWFCRPMVGLWIKIKLLYKIFFVTSLYIASDDVYQQC